MSEIKLFKDTKSEEAYGIIKDLYPQLAWGSNKYKHVINHHYRARSMHEAYWFVADAAARAVQARIDAFQSPISVKVDVDGKQVALDFGSSDYHIYMPYISHGLGPSMYDMMAYQWGAHNGINTSAAEWYIRLISLRYMEDWRRYSEYDMHKFSLISSDAHHMSTVRSWLYENSISYSFLRRMSEYDWAGKDIAGQIYKRVTDKVFWFYVVKDILVTVDFPTVVELHDGHLGVNGKPAIEWSDGAQVWCIDGIIDSKKHLIRRLTLGRIFIEENAEIRKRLVEEYGAERFFEDTDAVVGSRDSRGKLWRIPDATFDVLEVVNSTPNPDGSLKKYYLLVAAGRFRTASDAVAASFRAPIGKDRRAIWGMGTSRIDIPKYDPVVQT